MVSQKDVIEYESFKTTMKNIAKNSRNRVISKNTRRDYRTALVYYLDFVNGQDGLTKEMDPDNLIQEAKGDVELVKERLDLFFLWLQGQKVEGYKQREKSMRKTSACVRAYGQMRGFYTNNGITFGKWKTPNLADMTKEAIENDLTTPFFKLDKKRKVYLDRGMVKQFLANLKLRDQTILLAMLSSSQDSGDLFSLNVGDIRKQKDRERFFWDGTRSKTGIRFKTFFTIEATEFIKRYIKQERRDANGNEPLFVTRGNGGENRMNSNHLSGVFRDAARRMGVELGNGFQNPFRPKRLRHIFRTACTHSHVDEGYINAFMGHKTSQSLQYLEKPVTILELEFSKAEPLLTVYGIGGTEGLEKIQTELSEWKDKYLKQEEKVADLERKLDETIDNFTKNVEIVAKDLFNRLYGEIQEETKREEHEMTETIDQTKDVTEEEHREHIETTRKALFTKREEERAEKKEEIKVSPKEKKEPKKEKTWAELIHGEKEE